MGNVCPRTGGGAGVANGAEVIVGGAQIVVCAISLNVVFDDNVITIIGVVNRNACITARRDVIVLNAIIGIIKVDAGVKRGASAGVIAA